MASITCVLSSIPNAVRDKAAGALRGHGTARDAGLSFILIRQSNAIGQSKLPAGCCSNATELFFAMCWQERQTYPSGVNCKWHFAGSKIAEKFAAAVSWMDSW